MFKAHHVALSVKDLEASKKFYHFFGFKTVFDYVSESKDLRIAHLMLNSFILELFCYVNPIPKENKSLSDDLQIMGIKHFGLCVDSVQQVRDTIMRVGLVREQPEIKQGRMGITYFFVKDPDDNFVEIVQDDRKLTPG